MRGYVVHVVIFWWFLTIFIHFFSVIAVPKSDHVYSLLEPWLGNFNESPVISNLGNKLISLYVSSFKGKGLLIANGERWFRNRRLITPAFHFDLLKPYIYVYNQCTEILLVRERKGQEIAYVHTLLEENVLVSSLFNIKQCFLWHFF